ncbi:SCO2400 family protein [Streptomyces inhibens]
MDYCSSCRRNLNGALVCPGCGDYAPDIAPPAHRHRSAAASTAPAWETWQASEAPAPESSYGAHRSEALPIGSGASAEAVADEPDADASSSFEDTAAPTGQGRAARRRQLARWKKHRRRAMAATAFALVGGGLTVTALQNRPSTDQAHAAAAPDPETVGPPRTATTDAVSEQPDDRASRHPGSRPPLAAGRQPHSTAATPPASTTARQPRTAAAAPPSAAPSAAPHTAAAPSAQRAHTDSAGGTSSTGSHDNTGTAAAAPKTNAPASGGDSDAGSSPANTAPTTPEADPTSPSHVCLLGVVCL